MLEEKTGELDGQPLALAVTVTVAVTVNVLAGPGTNEVTGSMFVTVMKTVLMALVLVLC